MSHQHHKLAVKNMPVRRLNTDERMKRTYLNLNLQAAQEDKQISRKHDIQRMRSIRHLKKHQPDSWLLQKMKDPKNGKTFYRRCSVAAETIQMRWKAQKLGREAREKFQNMVKHKDALFDMIVYLVFYVLIITFACVRTPEFEIVDMKHLMRDLIVEEEFLVEDTHIYKSMPDVATEEELWQFLQGPFVGNLFPEDCYSKTSAENDACYGKAYRSNYLIGGVRLRQLRVSQESLQNEASACSHLKFTDKNNKPPACFENYGKWYDRVTNYFITDNIFDQEKLANKPRTRDIDTRNNSDITRYNMSSCFQYSHEENGIGNNYLSHDERTQYPSGIGYFCDFLYSDGANAKIKMKALEASEWFDDSTRILFVEFAVYNPSTNTIMTVRLMFEFLNTGGIVPTFHLDSCNFLHGEPIGSKVSKIMLEAAITIMCLGYAYIEVTEWYDLGSKAYFASVWNYLDLLNYFMLLSTQGYTIYLWILESKSIGDNEKLDIFTYIPLQEYVYISNLGNWIYSAVIVICTFKVFKYLQISPNLSMLIETLNEAVDTLCYFMIIIMVLTSGYSVAFVSTFAAHSDKFRSVRNAFGTLLYTMLGDFPEMDDIMKGNRVVGPMLFYSYLFIVGIIAFSMFLTIVSEEYLTVKERIKQKKENQEQDMIVDRLKYLIGKYKHRLLHFIGKASPKVKRRLSNILGLDRKRLEKLKEKEKRDMVRKRSSQKLLKHNSDDETKSQTNKYSVLPTDKLKDTFNSIKEGNEKRDKLADEINGRIELPPLSNIQTSPTVKRLTTVIDENEALSSKLKLMIEAAESQMDRIRIERETMYLDIWDNIKNGIALPENSDIKDRYEYEDPHVLVTDSLELIEERVTNVIRNSRAKLIELSQKEQKSSLEMFKLMKATLSNGTSSIGEGDNLLLSIKRGESPLQSVDEEDDDIDTSHVIDDLDKELELGIFNNKKRRNNIV
jgi:hypothetical protein